MLTRALPSITLGPFGIIALLLAVCSCGGGSSATCARSACLDGASAHDALGLGADGSRETGVSRTDAARREAGVADASTGPNDARFPESDAAHPHDAMGDAGHDAASDSSRGIPDGKAPDAANASDSGVDADATSVDAQRPTEASLDAQDAAADADGIGCAQTISLGTFVSATGYTFFVHGNRAYVLLPNDTQWVVISATPRRRRRYRSPWASPRCR